MEGQNGTLGSIWNITPNIPTLQVNFLRYNKIFIIATDINMFIIDKLF